METLLPPDVVDLARRVVTENLAAGRLIAVAESCTGGLVSAAITEIPGSSAVLDRSFITYSNEAKQEMLGVASDLIEAVGAVSGAVAWAMAQGAIARSRADVAVAISGIAGPEGGSALKPVGTVVFALARRGADPATETVATQMFTEASGRGAVRHAATLVALQMLLPGATAAIP